MENRQQTAKSFSEKWHNNRQLVFEETLREGSDILNWILTRNGLASTLAMARGGAVFVLDIGQPITIMDLARRMAELFGLAVKDE